MEEFKIEQFIEINIKYKVKKTKRKKFVYKKAIYKWITIED